MKKLMILALTLTIGMTAFSENRTTSNINYVNRTPINNDNFDLSRMYWDESTFAYEQVKTEENQRKMIMAQPPVMLEDSLERKQLNERAKLWNDPYKVAYLYVFLEGVGCLGYYTIKGKVSSVNSMVTNPEQVLLTDTGTPQPVVVSSPALDGSYGENGDGIFAFLSNGAYVETNLKYFLTDKPTKLSNVLLGEIQR